MKKVILDLHAVLVIAMLCVGLYSCTKDNEKEKNSEIVGVWVWEDKDYKETLTLNNDGSFSLVWKSEYSGDVESGTWTYNASNKELILNTVVGEEPGPLTLKVNLAGNAMMLVEEDGDEWGPYIKQ